MILQLRVGWGLVMLSWSDLFECVRDGTLIYIAIYAGAIPFILVVWN